MKTLGPVASVSNQHRTVSPGYKRGVIEGVLLLVIAGAFCVDILTPLGFSHGIVYLPIIVFAAAISNNRDSVLQLLILVSLLVLLGWFVSPQNVTNPLLAYSLLNRLLIISVFVAIGFLNHFNLFPRHTNDVANEFAPEFREESANRFQVMVEGLPVMVWTASPQGQTKFLNNATRQFFGDSVRLNLGKLTNSSFVHPSDQKALEHNWLRTISTDKKIFSAKARLVNQEGHYIWHQLNAHAVLNDRKEIIEWFGIATNIHSLKETQKKYRNIAKLFDNTFDSISDILFTVDSDWNFHSANTSARKCLGIEQSELIGESFWDLCESVFGKELERELDLRMIRNDWRPFEFESEQQSGIYRCSLYQLDSGGLVFYLQDISTERALRQQLGISQKLETLGILTGGIAHDFNNLLTIIMGNAELLCLGVKGDESMLKKANAVHCAASKGAQLVQQLLAYARRQPLKPEDVPVNKLINEITGLLRRSLSEAINVNLKLDDDLWSACIDPFQLESALMNLCINAMQAMPQGGDLIIETKNITVSDSGSYGFDEIEPGDYVVMSVSDNGQGIPPAALDKIFEPFYTTKETGNGLGLSMIYGFTKQSGGHVTVYSEQGIGTIFNLYLPKSDGKEIATPKFQGKLDIGGTETVLLVEDDQEVLEFTRNVLLSAGYQVLTARCAKDALGILKAGDTHIDLLFTDIIMPGRVYGTELAENALVIRKDIKIVFSSGYSPYLLQFKDAKVSESNYLKKPFQRMELLSKLRTILDASVTDKEMSNAVVAENQRISFYTQSHKFEQNSL